MADAAHAAGGSLSSHNLLLPIFGAQGLCFVLIVNSAAAISGENRAWVHREEVLHILISLCVLCRFVLKRAATTGKELSALCEEGGKAGADLARVIDFFQALSVVPSEADAEEEDEQEEPIQVEVWRYAGDWLYVADLKL